MNPVLAILFYFYKIYFNIILPIFFWVFQVASFLHVLPPKFCVRFSYPSYVPHSQPISASIIWSGTTYMEEHKSCSYSIRSFLHLAGTSSLLGPNILLSPLFSKHHQHMFFS